MTFGLGAPWTTTTAASASKLNSMNVVWGPGSDLAGLDKTQYKVVVCTATGSGLTIDHVYCANNAGDTWIDISSIADHNHSGTGVGGGSLQDVFRGSPTFMDTGFTYLNRLQKADWDQIVSSTGTITDDVTASENSIKLLTGATSGSGSTIGLKLSNMKLDFSKPSHFQTMLKLSTTASLALKAGVNCETVTAADDNTVKYEAQLCTVTNANWNLRTATGAANSESNTGIAFTTSKVSVRLEHFPTIGTPKVDMYVDSASAFTKTSDIPVSGSSGLLALMKFSLKNSAAADVNCWMYGCRLRYYTSSQWK